MTENRGQKSEFGRQTRRRPIERDYVAARWGSRKKDEGEKLGRCEGERKNETIMEVGNKMSTKRSSPCPLSFNFTPYTFRFEPFAVRLVSCACLFAPYPATRDQ